MENDEQSGKSSGTGKTGEIAVPFKGASVSLAVGYIILPGPSNPFQSGYTLTKTGNPIQTWSLQNVENPP